jgi:hypothetical protein
MIGGYFDGHPWAGDAVVEVEDPQSPLVAHLAPSFRFTEEYYQFRAFSRDQVRVLLTLDTQSVNMTAAGINRTDGDFALADSNYGKGRVFIVPLAFRQLPTTADSHHAAEGAALAHRRNRCRCCVAVRSDPLRHLPSLPTACGISLAPVVRLHPATSSPSPATGHQRILLRLVASRFRCDWRERM